MSQRFFYTNKIKTVQTDFTASQEETLYPATNLVTDNYSQTWRSTNAAGSVNIVQDFGSAIDIDTFFLGNVNLTSSATVQIQANSSDSWGAPPVDETLTVTGLSGDLPTTSLYHELSSAETYRYWRLVISDTSNPDSFYEVGEWWLGERVELAATQQHEINHRQTFQRGNVEHETEFQNRFVYTRSARRVFDVTFEKITAATRDQIRVLENTAEGSGFPFVFVQEVDVTPFEAFFVRLAGDVQVDRAAPQAYDINLTLIEEATGLSLPVVV